MSEQEQDIAIVKGPGVILREAREALGLSAQQIADTLHLRVSNITKIESDVLDEKLSMTFTKGYIKLYAKHVDVNEQIVLDAFEQLHTVQKPPAKLQSFSKRVAKQANDDRLMLMTYVVFAIVAALVFWWWWQQSDDTIAVNVSSVDVEQVEAPSRNINSLEENPLPEQAGAEIDENTSVEQDTANILTAGFNDTNDSAQINEAPIVEDSSIESTESDSEISQVELVELIFEFSGDCWVNLIDSSGEAIAYGVKSTGRVMTVSGYPPFEVTLGAPHSVQIKYNGEPVSLQGFTAGRRAKFNLPLNEVFQG